MTSINFYKIDASGNIIGSKSFCTNGNENVKKLFYSQGGIFFGGEFKNDSSFIIIGHNEFYNVATNLRHAYTSFLLDSDFNSNRAGIRFSNDKAANSRIRIFPNPTTNSISIQFNLANESNIEYYIYDINGIEREYMNYKKNYYDNLEIKKFESLEPGLYVIKVFVNGRIEKVDKIIKL